MLYISQLKSQIHTEGDSNPFLSQLYLIGSFIKDCFLSSVSHRNQFVHNPLNSGTLTLSVETRAASIISLYQALPSQWQKLDLIQDGL